VQKLKAKMKNKKEQQEESEAHLKAFDQAMTILNKHNHGRCDVYHTEDKVYFVCKKPVR
jgi:hypothetical protein